MYLYLISKLNLIKAFKHKQILLIYAAALITNSSCYFRSLLTNKSLLTDLQISYNAYLRIGFLGPLRVLALVLVR